MMIALIDLENIGNKGFKGLDNLSSKDRVIVFYKENSTVSIKVLVKYCNSKMQKEFVCVKESTKNAVDFQIVACLGKLSSELPDEEFYVVSNDGGFDAAVSYLKDFGKKISRKSDLASCKTTANATAAKEKVEATVQSVAEYAPKFAEKANEIADVVNKYKTKTAINNNLMKMFSSKEVGEILKSVKPLLVGKN